MRMQGHSADADGGKRALGEALVGSDFDIILEDVWDDRVVAAVRLKGHTGHLLVTSPRLYLVFGAEHFVLPEWLPAHSLGLSSSPPPPPPPPPPLPPPPPRTDSEQPAAGGAPRANDEQPAACERMPEVRHALGAAASAPAGSRTAAARTLDTRATCVQGLKDHIMELCEALPEAHLAAGRLWRAHMSSWQRGVPPLLSPRAWTCSWLADEYTGERRTLREDLAERIKRASALPSRVASTVQSQRKRGSLASGGGLARRLLRRPTCASSAGGREAAAPAASAQHVCARERAASVRHVRGLLCAGRGARSPPRGQPAQVGDCLLAQGRIRLLASGPGAVRCGRLAAGKTPSGTPSAAGWRMLMTCTPACGSVCKAAAAAQVSRFVQAYLHETTPELWDSAEPVLEQLLQEGQPLDVRLHAALAVGVRLLAQRTGVELASVTGVSAADVADTLAADAGALARFALAVLASSGGAAGREMAAPDQANAIVGLQHCVTWQAVCARALGKQLAAWGRAHVATPQAAAPGQADELSEVAKGRMHIHVTQYANSVGMMMLRGSKSV